MNLVNMTVKVIKHDHGPVATVSNVMESYKSCLLLAKLKKTKEKLWAAH